MRSFLAMLLVLAASGRALAAEPAKPGDQLDGSWMRVFERCGAPLDPVPDFSASGGDPLVGRRMLLTLAGDKFSAKTFISLRCGQEGKTPRPPEDSNFVDCLTQTESHGALTKSAVGIHLNAEFPAGNNWGLLFQDWSYRLLGSVLELSTDGTGNCSSGPLYIYFVRSPDS